MQKKFKIEVDCANCAAKIETAIKALPGVKNASVSFMAQKLLLELPPSWAGCCWRPTTTSSTPC